MSEFRLLEIVRIELETPSTKSIYFKPIDGKTLTFVAGQFLTVILKPSTFPIRRSYSISSLPGEELIRITVKRISNGEGSREIFDRWQLGNSIECLEPAGKFKLPEITTPCDLIFIAAGSGISPIMSMLQTALLQMKNVRLHLLYSSKSKEECIFYNELNRLADSFPNQLQIHWFLSDAKNIFDAHLTGEFLENYLQNALNFPLSNAHVFSCGPESYMYLSEVVSRSVGIPAEHFHQELFYQEIPSEIQTKFSTRIRQVNITYKDKLYHLKIPSNETILAFAKKNNIELPWSCESGRCSTCMAKCISGKVEMVRNEVLTDNDLMQGWVLICTGHAQSDEVVLEIPSSN